MSFLRHFSRRYSAHASAFKQAVEDVAQTRTSVLSNGLRVSSQQTASKAATVGVYINSGSRFETEQTNGTANLLEHVLLKGTGKRSKGALEAEVDSLGGHLSASTSRETTSYSLSVGSGNVAQATEILSDIVSNSAFAQVEQSKAAVLNQINAASKNKKSVTFDNLHAVAYQGTSLAQTVYGPERNIKAITVDDLRKYVQSNFTASRIVLAAAGGVDHDELVKSAEAAFGKLPSGQIVNNVTKPAFTGSDIRYRDDFIPEIHLAIAIQGVPWGHPDYFSLKAAQYIIGNWDHSNNNGRHVSSKLATECAEDHYAHKFTSFYNSYSDTALWGAYASAPRDHIDDFIHSLLLEWVRLSVSATNVEVERAKRALRTHVFAEASTASLADEIGNQVLHFNNHTHTSAIEAQIAAVTPSSVQAAATKYIYDKCPVISAYGSTEGLPDYNRIRSGMFWLRI